jgi:uncharacterized C2H2 Zn-finger protein
MVDLSGSSHESPDSFLKLFFGVGIEVASNSLDSFSAPAFDSSSDVRLALTCQICSCAFGGSGSLKNHVNSAHNNLKAFECKICLKANKHKKYLKIPVDTAHKRL